MAFDTVEIGRMLSKRGLRLTRQRRAVLDAVAAAPTGVSPVQVYDAARRDCPELGLTTVYRTLDLLTAVGALRRVHGTSHCEAFVPTGAAHGHTVVCEACGHAAEFTDCEMAPVIAAAARQTGYRITEHFLQLSGTCPACAHGERKRTDDGGAR